MDFGHFVPSAEGYKGFFCIIDVCSRTLRITLSRDVTSSSAVKALGDWIRVYDTPFTLIVDNGSENKLDLSIYKRMNINLMLGTAHHHSPKHAENAIKRVKDAIVRSVPQGKIGLWPHFIPTLEHALASPPCLAGRHLVS